MTGAYALLAAVASGMAVVSAAPTMEWWDEGGGTAAPSHIQQQSQLSELAPPRIAVLTAYFGSALKLRDLTFPNKMQYAKQHNLHLEDGYSESPELRALIDAALHEGHPAVGQGGEGAAIVADQSAAYNTLLFLKLEVLKWYLQKWRGVYDFVFWTDADSIFLNHSVSLLKYCALPRNIPLHCFP